MTNDCRIVASKGSIYPSVVHESNLYLMCWVVLRCPGVKKKKRINGARESVSCWPPARCVKCCQCHLQVSNVGFLSQRGSNNIAPRFHFHKDKLHDSTPGKSMKTAPEKKREATRQPNVRPFNFPSQSGLDKPGPTPSFAATPWNV